MTAHTAQPERQAYRQPTGLLARATSPPGAQHARLAVPSPPERLVVRTRLLDALDRGNQQPLTLISAPAGTGKTVAAASWIAAGRASGPVVWVSVTDDCAGPGLWSLIYAGLRRSISAAALPRDGAAPPGTRTPATLTMDAISDLIVGQPAPLTLVLDCDEDLPKEIAAGLHHLLRTSGDQLRMVLITRADPLLPLHLYRLDEAIVEVRMAELAFTPAEARELLAHRGVELSPGVLDVVMERTRGWAAGLLLTSMSLSHCSDQDSAARVFSGASGTVAEYLLSEVLDAQAPAVRELLLQTSIVDVLRPGLAEALAGPYAQRALTFLARGNAFLDLVPQTSDCYRYHPLFRELLAAQLAFESPSELIRLHLVAANWYAGEGRVEQAVRHAAAARAWKTAARYLIDDLGIAALALDGSRSGVAELLGQLPDSVDDAGCDLVRAALAIASSDHNSAADRLTAASSTFDAEPAAAWPAGRLSWQLLAALLADATADPAGVIRATEHAEELIPELVADRLAAHPELLVCLHSLTAKAQLAQGNLTAAGKSYLAAAHSAELAGCPAEQIDSCARVALVTAWSGQYRRATRIAEHALSLQYKAQLPPSSAAAAAEVALAWIAAEKYDLAQARRHSLAATKCVSEDGDPMSRLMLALVQSRIRRAHGDIEAAHAILADVLATVPDAPDWLSARLRVEDALIDVVSGESADAAVLSEELTGAARDEAAVVRERARLTNGHDLDEPVSALAGAGTALPARVDSLLLESFRCLRRGDEQQAADALNRSLRLAAPEQLRRPFRDAPSDVRRLLRANSDLAVQHRWLTGAGTSPRRRAPHSIDGPVDRQNQQAPALLVEPLTQKESEVLRYLAQLLTTEEIAGAMFVSVNTIRTHVRNILRKLAVSRRNEAIRRARELGILPS